MNWWSTIFSSMGRPFRWWVVVAPWEQGVRIRFGKNPKRLDAGIHFRLPFLDRVYVQSTRARICSTVNNSISTKDGKIITIALLIRYRVRDVVDMYRAVAQPEGVLLFDALSLAVKYLSERTMHEARQAELEDAINDELTAEDRYGMEDVEASVVGFCQARCFRVMTGDGWITTGLDMDTPGNSGER